jgi:hypothetical protein
MADQEQSFNKELGGFFLVNEMVHEDDPLPISEVSTGWLQDALPVHCAKASCAFRSKRCFGVQHRRS